MDWMDSLGTVLIIVLALLAAMAIRRGGGHDVVLIPG